MGLVVLEGLVITVLVLTGFRMAVFRAIPAAAEDRHRVGIGLFIALIGFVDAGVVRRAAAGTVPVELGVGGQPRGWPTLVFVLGLLLTAVLVARRVRGAILIGILVVHRAGGHRRGDRATSARRSTPTARCQPERLGAERARPAGQGRRHARPRPARASSRLFGGVRRGRRRRGRR